MGVRSRSRGVTKVLGDVAKEAGGVVGKTAGTTRATTIRALRGVRFKKDETSPMLEGVVEETMMGALQGGKDAASDAASVVKGAVIGTVEGVGTLTAISGDVLRYATRAAIRSTRAMNGDVAAAAQVAVEAGTQAGEQAGMEHDEAALASAAGVLDATGEMDDTIANAIAKSIAGTASEIRALVEARLKKPLVILVGSNRSNAEQLSQSLKQQKYDMRIATSLSELDAAVQTGERVSLVVMDLAGFDQAVWKYCEKLQMARIPFLVIADQRSPSIQQESMRYGARGVFTKPVGVKDLAEYIRATLGR
jgi:CheY-like chemotaxis protein